MMRMLLGLLAILFALASAPAAFAQSCNFSYTPSSSMAFGNIDVTDNTVFDTTITLNITCTGGNNRFVRVCPSIGSGTGGAIATTRYLLSGANQMTFNIYQDSGHATIWGSYFWGFAPLPPTIDLRLPPAGSGTATATLYARINASQTTLPAGTYSSNFTGNHTAFAYDYRNAGTCNAIGNTNSTQVPFTAAATNVKSCTVTASDLNFGAVASLSSNLDVDGSASVTCTNQTPYRVLLDDGLTGTGPTSRRMTLGGNHVTYGLYRDAARTLAWGDNSGVNSLSGTGSGNAQTIDIYGRVPPQTIPPAGTYSDTIVITVEY